MKVYTFNNWLNNQSTTEEVQSLLDVEIKKDPIIADVDTIMTSLETLAKELTEELDNIEETSVNELTGGAGTATVDFIKSWITGIKAAKSQQKVNKIKMNAADLEFAADQATGDKKSALNDKSKKVSSQASDLQRMVNDRFSGKGNYVDSQLHKEKIKGQLEIIKRTSGMEDDPSKKSDLKSKMQELINKYKEEEEAITKLEDDNKEDIIKAKEQLTKAKKPEETKKPENSTISTIEKPAETEKPVETEKPAETETTEDKIAQKEADIKKIDNNIKVEELSIVKNSAELKSTEEDKSKATNPESYNDKIAKIKKDIEASKEDIKALNTDKNNIKKELQKLTTPKESLSIRAKELGLNELAIEINNREDWQLHEGTAIRDKYENIIKKTEYSEVLNESKYSIDSIKDAFSKLI